MKTILKFTGLILLALSFSLIQQNKRDKAIEKQNVWVMAGVEDHKEFKNNVLMELENGNKN